MATRASLCCGFLAEFTSDGAPVPRGSQANPGCGETKGLEVLACTLQLAGSSQVDQFGGLKLFLTQLLLISII